MSFPVEQEEIHDRKVREIAKNYQEKGYDVVIYPGQDQTPTFLSGFSPDLIAKSKRESVVVEVKVGTRTSGERYREIAERVTSQAGWRFELVYAPYDELGELPRDSPLLNRNQIRKRLEEADLLHSTGALDSAILLAWTANEALLRLRWSNLPIPKNLPPSALVKELFSAGELSIEQYDTLIDLLKIRNSIVHGFRTERSEEAYRKLRNAIEQLIREG